MFEALTKKYSLKTNNQNTPLRKILLTLVVLFLFRFGNTIPLAGIDQEALKKSLLQLGNSNPILQVVNMYSGGGGTTLLSPFSLGIIPFINASILIDLLTAIVPQLEKLQSEEGELGRKQLKFYKKILTLLFASVQTIFLIVNFLSPYFYDTQLFNLGTATLELVTGTLITVWLSEIIDNQGIGNGTSIIIFTNIVITLISKNMLVIPNLDSSFAIQIVFLLFILLLICISQTARITIDVVSARQLAFLENKEKITSNTKFSSSFQIKDNGLSIRLNQAGIFPIIIASNLLPFLSYLTQSISKEYQLINNGIYYLLIIGFNYFYTTIFWDPEKISEQLRKASVSIVNVTPGKETISYLENVVRSSSLLGGVFLCGILATYDLFKLVMNAYLLNQLNISSLIILVGVSYDIQKNIKALYKNILDKSN